MKTKKTMGKAEILLEEIEKLFGPKWHSVSDIDRSVCKPAGEWSDALGMARPTASKKLLDGVNDGTWKRIKVKDSSCTQFYYYPGTIDPFLES